MWHRALKMAEARWGFETDTSGQVLGVWKLGLGLLVLRDYLSLEGV